MHLRTDTNAAQAHFANVPTISHSRNAFTQAAKHITTIQFDYLYPVFHQLIYPGDSISYNHEMLSRLTTQVAVLYDDLYIDVHAWYVPLRLIHANFNRFQFNEQPTGPTQDNSSLTTPNIDLATLGAGGFTSKSLYDYFDYPTKINTAASSEHINNYYARCYNFIWNTNYRDQNLQNAVVVDTDDGPDLASDYVLLKRGKRHDMFTSCLPAQQKGTAVSMPISGTTNVLWQTTGNFTIGRNPATGAAVGTGTTLYTSNPDGYIKETGGNAAVNIDPNGSLYVNLNNIINGPNLNQLRTSIAVQQLLEADARGGTRSVEAVQNRWGVTIPDSTAQRPLYLGGCTFAFDGHIVPQTSATSGSNYQADLKQFSQTQSALGIDHSFVEHGVFMILVSARSNITYQEGLARELSLRTRYDFFQPEFANLGEVAVLNKEIYFQGSATPDNQTFGFGEYAYNLRYSKNRVSGEMRSNYATSRDSKHMADDYSALPTLGATWIQSATAISRNITVSAATADPIELHCFTHGTIARVLPMYSVPGLMRL